MREFANLPRTSVSAPIYRPGPGFRHRLRAGPAPFTIRVGGGEPWFADNLSTRVNERELLVAQWVDLLHDGSPGNVCLHGAVRGIKPLLAMRRLMEATGVDLVAGALDLRHTAVCLPGMFDKGIRVTKPEGNGGLVMKRSTGRRLHGAIAHRLGRAIVSGFHAPGTALPSEVELAETLQVSRGAVREAMQGLAAKGLVESRTKAGTRVLPRTRWNLLDPDVLGWTFTGEPDPALVRDIFELRAMVEPGAAQLAAARRTPADLRAMKEALAVMAAETLATDAGRAADRDFHDAILRATANDALVVLSATIGAAVHWTTQYKQRGPASPRDPIPDHANVYEAIAAGDGDRAAAAMRVLVVLALEDTAAQMELARQRQD